MKGIKVETMTDCGNHSEVKCGSRTLAMARAWSAHIRAMVAAIILRQAKLSEMAGGK
jgi:hypothetical protein